MRFAYADPPYPGNARRIYGDHSDYGGEVDHGALIADLERDFDAWLLSTSCQALPEVLALCPPGRGEREGVRILSWHKPTTPHYSGVLSYGWEPVILRGGRRPLPGQGVAVRDTLTASPAAYNGHKPASREHVTGQKPPQFWRWIFNCVGALPGDHFVDLFPGSGVGADQWARFAAQPSLPLLHPEPEKNRRRRIRKEHPELAVSLTPPAPKEEGGG